MADSGVMYATLLRLWLCVIALECYRGIVSSHGNIMLSTNVLHTSLCNAHMASTIRIATNHKARALNSRPEKNVSYVFVVGYSNKESR